MEARTRLEKVRREYEEFKRGGYVDPYLLREEVKSSIDSLKSKDERYEELRSRAEDILIDVTFMIEGGHCSPFKVKSIK